MSQRHSEKAKVVENLFCNAIFFVSWSTFPLFVHLFITLFNFFIYKLDVNSLLQLNWKWRRLNPLKLWASLRTLSASQLPLPFFHSTPPVIFLFSFLTIVYSHSSVALNEPGWQGLHAVSAATTVFIFELWIGFPLRSHYPAGPLPAASRRQLSSPFSPLFCLVFIPPSSSSNTLSFAILLRVLEVVDVHSFDLDAAVGPGTLTRPF